MADPVVLEGAYYKQNAQKVQSFSASGTISDDTDVALASSGTPTLTLPAHPKPGKTVRIAAVSGAVTVAANSGQTLNGSGATAVAAGFTRDYTAVTDLIWVAQALA